MAAKDKFAARDLFERFPDDDACLDHLMEVRYGMRHVCSACQQETPCQPARKGARLFMRPLQVSRLSVVGGHRPGKRGRGAAGRMIVMGLTDRGGEISAEVIPDVKNGTLRDVVLRNVAPLAIVSPDELVSYGLLAGDGCRHGHMKHVARVFAAYDHRSGETRHATGVETFWNLFKASIRSTHIHISAKYMQRYLDEFTFRPNSRQMENAMVDLLIGAL